MGERLAMTPFPPIPLSPAELKRSDLLPSHLTQNLTDQMRAGKVGFPDMNLFVVADQQNPVQLDRAPLFPLYFLHQKGVPLGDLILFSTCFHNDVTHENLRPYSTKTGRKCQWDGRLDRCDLDILQMRLRVFAKDDPAVKLALYGIEGAAVVL